MKQINTFFGHSVDDYDEFLMIFKEDISDMKESYLAKMSKEFKNSVNFLNELEEQFDPNSFIQTPIIGRITYCVIMYKRKDILGI